MGRQSKGKRQTKAAIAKRKENHKPTGPRFINEVLPANNPDSPPENEKRESKEVKRYRPEANFKPRLNRVKSSNLTLEPGRKFVRSNIQAARMALPVIDDVERKWLAIVNYAILIDPKSPSLSLSKSQMDSVGAKFGVNGKTVKNWFDNAMKGNSMLRNDGSGRNKTVFDIANQSLHEIINEYGGALSQATLTHLVKQNKAVDVSQQTIQRILSGKNFLLFDFSYLILRQDLTGKL